MKTVIKRLVFYIQIQLESPLNVASGEDDQGALVVKKEKKPPCSRLYIPDKKSLLFEVSYYKNRINFEVYHALTDGTGAMHFLRQLVSLYLRKSHPEAGQKFRTGKKPRERTRKRTAFPSIILPKVPKSVSLTQRL